MNGITRSGLVLVACGLVAGMSGLFQPDCASATELEATFVVAESAGPRANTLLEDMISPERRGSDGQESRAPVSDSVLATRPFSAPIVVRPDGRSGQRSPMLHEELMMQEVLSPYAGLRPTPPSITLEYGERRIEVPLALPAPFIFDPAHGIFVFDLATLTPSETYAFTSYLVTRQDPPSRPLPSINNPGPSLTGGPDAISGLVAFIKSLANNPDLGLFAVIGPGLAALGLVRRFRSEQSHQRKPVESKKPEGAPSRAVVPVTPQPEQDHNPPGTMAPECTENLPARRSAA